MKESEIDIVQVAIDEFKSLKGKVPAAQIAKKYGIPKSTFIQRLNEKTHAKGYHDHRFRFSDYTESLIEAYIIFLVFRLTPPDLGLVAEIAAKIGGVDHVSDSWVRSFVKRSHFLIITHSSHIDIFRVKENGEYPIQLFFEIYSFYVKYFKIEAKNIWNLDETGFHFGEITKRYEIVTVQDATNVKSQDISETISVLESVSLDGKLGSPLFIFKGARISPSWLSSRGEKNYGVAITDSGYMNEDIFLLWMRTQFGTAKAKYNAPWRIFIMDGHKSHTSVEVMNYLIDRHIIPIYFPSHMTNILQPLDRTCFGVIKKKVRNKIKKELVNGDIQTKNTFVDLYLEERPLSFSKECIRKAWEKTGILNNDPSIALAEYHKQMNRGCLSPDSDSCPKVQPPKSDDYSFISITGIPEYIDWPANERKQKTSCFPVEVTKTIESTESTKPTESTISTSEELVEKLMRELSSAQSQISQLKEANENLTRELGSTRFQLRQSEQKKQEWINYSTTLVQEINLVKKDNENLRVKLQPRRRITIHGNIQLVYVRTDLRELPGNPATDALAKFIEKNGKKVFETIDEAMEAERLEEEKNQNREGLGDPDESGGSEDANGPEDSTDLKKLGKRRKNKKTKRKPRKRKNISKPMEAVVI